MSDLYLFPVIKTHSNKLKTAYEVYADFSVEYGGETITVPKFFQYDGASIPWLGYYVVGTPFKPRFMKAAVVHDWLYHTHQLDRKQSDRLFYKMLIDDGVGKNVAILMRETVEKLGGRYWKNDDDDKDYIAHLIKIITEDARNPSDYGLKTLD